MTLPENNESGTAREQVAILRRDLDNRAIASIAAIAVQIMF